MGFFEDYERRRKERQETETQELIEHFGGVDGCLKIIFFPFTIPYYLFKDILAPIVIWLFKLVFGISMSIIIILLSLFILTPFKIAFYIISFGNWNGFEGRNLSERLSDFWGWLNDIDTTI